MNTPDITTDRLVLRRPRASDLDAYTHYCHSDRSAFVGGPYSDVQAFEKLSAMIGHWVLRGFGRFVFADRTTDRPIGHVGALQPDAARLPEMTWTIWRGQDEGRGYAFEAGRAFLDHASGAFGLSQMAACVHRDNRASRVLAERLGGVLNPETPPPDWMPEAVVYDMTLTG